MVVQRGNLQLGESDSQGGVLAFKTPERVTKGGRVHRLRRVWHPMELATHASRSRAGETRAVQAMRAVLSMRARKRTAAAIPSIPSVAVHARLNSLERFRSL